jgi:hypothetical protein
MCNINSKIHSLKFDCCAFLFRSFPLRLFDSINPCGPSRRQSPISLGLIQSTRDNSVSVTPYRPAREKRALLIAHSDFFAAGSTFPRRL